MKKIKTVMLVALMALMLVGCSAKEEPKAPETPATLGGIIAQKFSEIAADDKTTAAMADELMAMDELETVNMAMDVEPGFLNGFDSEVDGFNEGTMFSPMISALPFVGYVFKSDDAEALKVQLKEKANLRWNVCTEAKEQVIESKGNVVLFVMCPESFEE